MKRFLLFLLLLVFTGCLLCATINRNLERILIPMKSGIEIKFCKLMTEKHCNDLLQ